MISFTLVYMQTSGTKNKVDRGTFKVHYMGYLGTCLMILNEELGGQISVCFVAIQVSKIKTVCQSRAKLAKLNIPVS